MRYIMSIVLMATGCTGSLKRSATASVDGACTPVAGAAEILKPGARILVGEAHGNAETPRAVGELACLALARNTPVRVALELPAAEDAAIATFLASKGSSSDRSALVRGAFWTEQSQDGRSSRAVVELIERVRQLRHRGGDINVVTFDASANDRDLAMAERLAAAIIKEPKATFIMLSGNLHTRKTVGRAESDRAVRPPSVFMAEHLARRGVALTTLNAGYGRGSTWACMPECGPVPLGKGDGNPLGVVMRPSPDGAYDGVLDVGIPSYSPPAAVPLTEAQMRAARELPYRSEAMAAYDGKQFASCGDLFDELAARYRREDDAYNAGCCWALAGNTERAFSALAGAIDLGFREPELMVSDPDLARLRSDPRWQPLVARARR